MRRLLRRYQRMRLAWAWLIKSRGVLVWVRLLRPNMVVLDLGANVGYYSFFASNKIGPGGRVYAFEPNHEAFSELQRQLPTPRFSNVIMRNTAVSDTSETSSLHIDPSYSESGSLYPLPESVNAVAVEVECVALDDVIHEDHVDVVKIDVEGNEVKALRGMTRILDNNPAIVLYLEINPERLEAANTNVNELFDLLTEYRFELYAIDDRTGKLTLVSTAQVIMQSIEDYGALNFVASRGHPYAVRSDA